MIDEFPVLAVAATQAEGETIVRDAADDPADRSFRTDRIVGIYLGWRGDTSNIPVHEQFTFWDRRSAAERVASVHMKETLIRIMEATKEHPGSKCFIAGHSMGGMIIGKSIAPVLTTLLLTDQIGGARMPVDLVLLQNPALEALASWQTIDLLKRLEVGLELRSRDGSVRRADGPLIAAITSEADFATRVAYPFGRNIANLGMSFRDADSDDMPSQRRLATHAVGHVDFLVSHHAFVDEGEIVIERKPNAWNDTPFWVIRVSSEISRDHGDVNNPLFRQLTAQLLQANEVYRTDLETWVTRSAAEGETTDADAGADATPR
jgi:hypothetical protein